MCVICYLSLFGYKYLDQIDDYDLQGLSNTE